MYDGSLSDTMKVALSDLRTLEDVFGTFEHGIREAYEVPVQSYLPFVRVCNKGERMPRQENVLNRVEHDAFWTYWVEIVVNAPASQLYVLAQMKSLQKQRPVLLLSN